MNPFEYSKAINMSKQDIMIDDLAEKEYNSFIVNRSLSYFPDTVLYANEMNVNHHIDARLQFDFFINIVKKRKRFSKWFKATELENLELIKEYYGYSNEKAKSVYKLFSNDELLTLKNRIYKGGRSK
tara:strand:- start:481 stop:861 length:381 start_codon:yes stop_codon:yes gene_type:complete